MSETARRLTSGSVVFSSKSDAADARASGSEESLATMASSCARMAVTAVFNASMKAAKKARRDSGEGGGTDCVLADGAAALDATGEDADPTAIAVAEAAGTNVADAIEVTTDAFGSSWKGTVREAL